ncbi:hypothetical protein DSO57_1032899 [Entomophthora muscae]|uniref:Uncharacterized protein n=1 Tax=Entomophthora muscae TaxID=34485 RepID=A0ACC2RR69_9FUNG|nr:hypothetical protein DSO57_1032899 [Entomophthora muscae]
MNALVNILDNNSSTFKEAGVTASLFVSETPKKNGSLFNLVDQNSSNVNINLNFNQSLPHKLPPSQSTINNVDLKRLESTPGDVGNNGEAGDLLCPVLGSLVAIPSVVPAKTTSWSPPSVGLS